MKRLATIITCLGFLAMLAATSKRPDPPRPATGPPAQPLPVPPTTNWQIREQQGAGVIFQMPPNATLRDGGASSSGRFFIVRLASNVDVQFDTAMGERTAIDREREWYRTKVPGFAGFAHDAPDALVAELEDNGKRFCQVTACTNANPGTRMCTRAGSLDAQLTLDECAQVIAIARSVTHK